MNHSGYLQEAFTGGAKAGCSCGWEGPEHPSILNAQIDLDGHYAEQAAS